jgi:hypothetical protein
MKEYVFKNALEFADWSRENEIFNMEYLGSLGGRKSQNCFGVDIEKKETLIICIEKKVNDQFFMNKEEMNLWIELCGATDVMNFGLSQLFIGFNIFKCKLGGREMNCYIEATELLI